MQQIAERNVAQDEYTHYFDTAANCLSEIMEMPTVLGCITADYWILSKYEYFKRILTDPIVECWFSPEIRPDSGSEAALPQVDADDYADITLRNNCLWVSKYSLLRRRNDDNYDDVVRLPELIRSYSKNMVKIEVYSAYNRIYFAATFRSIAQAEQHKPICSSFLAETMADYFSHRCIADRIEFLITCRKGIELNGPLIRPDYDFLNDEETCEACDILAKKICAAYARNARKCMMYISD